jgi:hypothetical protein
MLKVYCSVWMERNEGRVEGRGVKRFNEPYLGVCLKWKGEGFKKNKRVKAPLQTSYF